ncbi:MAG: GAF domain-containing protein [Nostocaceae cyanobacterium]|nr:GAF domain-containing protein [Nostocaceae cyanobacterium]
MTSIFNLPLLMAFLCLAGVALQTKIWKVGQSLNMQLVTGSSAIAGIGLWYWLSLQGNLAVEVTGDALGMGNLLLAAAPFLFGRWLFPNPEATETQVKQWHSYEQLPVGVLVIGAERKILFSNTKAREILQRQETELLGNQAFAEDWQVVQGDGTPFTEVTTLLQPVKDMVVGVFNAKTSQRIWLQVNTQPLDGKNQQVICTFSDISRYQQCELALGEVQSRLEKQSHALVALAVNTLDNGDLQSSFQELTAAVACTLGIERVGIWLYNRESSEIYCVSLYEQSVNNHTSGDKIKTAEYPVYFQALKTEGIIVAHNVHSDKRTRELSASYFAPAGITSMLDSPIWFEGQMVGIICLEHVGKPRQWTVEEQIFARSIADLASLAIEGYERHQAEAALRVSEAKCEKLAANVPGMIYQFLLHSDGSYSFPYVSRYSRELNELEPEDMQQNPEKAMALVHPDDQPRIKQLLASAGKALQPSTYEGRIITPSGKLKWVQSISRPENLPNGDILYDCLLIDITTLKQTEAELRESEELYRTLAKNFPKGAVILFDRDLRYTLVEGAGITALGIDKQFVEGKTIWEVLPPDRCDYLEPKYRGALAGEESIFELVYADRVYQVQVLPVKNTSQEIFAGMIVAQDITERKRVEQALRDSEERLRRLSETTFEAIILQKGSKIIDVNQAATKMFGYQLSEMMGMNRSSLLTPEYREISFNHIASGSQEPYEATCVRKDGSTFSAELQGRTIDYQGENLRITAIRDITERKRAQAKLAKRERYLAALVDVQRHLLAADKCPSEGRCNCYNQILETLGKAANASRVYLFENYRDTRGRLLTSQRAEWCTQGIAAEIDNPILQNLPYEDYFPRWQSILSRGEVMSGIVADFPVTEQEILAPQGILSILILPLMVNGEFFGFIGFDNCHHAKLWTSLEVDLLSAAAAAISLHKERSLAQQELQQAKAELEIRVQERTKALKQANEQLLIEIAERSSAEAALQESEAKFKQLAQQEELINRLATQIRHSLDLDTILETTVQEIRQLLKVDRCGFAWYRPPTCSLGQETTEESLSLSPHLPISQNLQQTEGIWELVKEARNPNLPNLIGKYPASLVGTAGEKLLNLEMVRVDDVDTTEDASLRQFLQSLGTKSKLALPIKHCFGEIGVVLLSQCSAPRQWEDSEIELLMAVTNQLAIAIDQSHTHAAAQMAAKAAQERSDQWQQALQQLQHTQTQLVHSEKMSSLGQLVAGIAHEMNNAICSIVGNLPFATQYIHSILDILQLYQEHYTQPAPEIVARSHFVDLEFVSADLPKLLESMEIGAKRISQIILSLRNFSRLDEADMKRVNNLHEGIDNTLLILQHRLRNNGRLAGIQVVKEYADLPKIECYPGSLNQVFMNILNNAIDALEERRKKVGELESAIEACSFPVSPVVSLPPPTIRIITELSRPGYVIIRVADNGTGMNSYVKSRLFDPFFTTKPVGSGTGLGLSVSYQIIVEKHKGLLQCFSEPGEGSEFVIEIPMQQK